MHPTLVWSFATESTRVEREESVCPRAVTVALIKYYHIQYFRLYLLLIYHYTLSIPGYSNNDVRKCIPYTAFTVGLLGFYECVCMPFGLTNTLITFQRLIESCLGDLHLQYCVTYLDDIIIFPKDPAEH